MKKTFSLLTLLLAFVSGVLAQPGPPGGGGGSGGTNTFVYNPPHFAPGLKLAVPATSGTNLALNLLEADPAGTYAIYFATNLNSISWSNVLQGTNGQTNFATTFPLAANGFFRVTRSDTPVTNTESLFATFPYESVNTNLTGAVVDGGPAAAMAILVDSTNFAAASWIPFSSIPLVDVGTNEGTHAVWFGFKGSDGIAYWTMETITLDQTPPTLVITNPVSSTTARPIIQLQGYSPEPLSSVYYDVTNAAGALTNQQGFVTAQYFDTNSFAATTNYFQCFDIGLTNGVNTITLHATDAAGNVTTTNIAITLDFSGDTNPPTITLIWPLDGANIGGDQFTLRGILDDETAQVTAQIVDTNGTTNVFAGLVERNGQFWFDDLPLTTNGNNTVTITAIDAAGNTSATNITLVRSAVNVTINSLDDSYLNQSSAPVSGTVSDHTYGVWVNGVQAAVDAYGNWATTNNAPVYGNGTATFDVAAYPAGQSPSFVFGKKRSPFASNTSGQPVQQTLAQDQPPVIYVYEYSDQWVYDDGSGISWGASKKYAATTNNFGGLLRKGNGTSFYHAFYAGSGEGWWDTDFNWSDTNSLNQKMENHWRQPVKEHDLAKTLATSEDMTKPY